MNGVSAHTRACVRVLIPGRTTGEDNRAGVKRGARIADVGPVFVVSVVVTVVVTQTAVELQSSKHYWNRRQIILGRSLRVHTTQTVAGAVDELRPRVRSRHLEAAPEAAIQMRLQSMIRRVPLTRFQDDGSIVRVEAQRAGGQPRIPVGFGRQSVAF